jgi:DNA-binding NarL/FixJ family response regulator
MNCTGIKIALVDDSSLIRNCIQEILKAWGHKIVLEAVDGKDFLRQLNAGNAPDVCITDINMPEMNGYELVKALREKWPDIKIIAFSITGGQRESERIIQAGAHAFVSKLSPITELQKVLQSFNKSESPEVGKSERR